MRPHAIHHTPTRLRCSLLITYLKLLSSRYEALKVQYLTVAEPGGLGLSRSLL